MVRDDNTMTSYQVSLPDDLYVMLDFGTDLPYLLDVLEDLFVTAGFPVFFTKIGLGGMGEGRVWERGGVQIGALSPFTIQTNDIFSYRVCEILGLTPGTGSVSSEEFGPSNHVIIPGKLHGLCWRSYKQADQKFTDVVQEQSTSGGQGYDPQLTRWGTSEIRTFSYTNIPAVHVRSGRDQIQAYNEVGDAPFSGIASPFDEFWRAAISFYAPIYVTHHVGSEAPEGWYATPVAQREFLMAGVSSKYADSLSSCLSRRVGRSAEHYDIEFALRRTEENSRNTYSQG